MTLPAGTLVADGLDAALLGWGQRVGQPPLAVYDRARCVDILMTSNGWTYEDAEEWMSYNVEGAWVGDGTPLFITLDTELPDPDVDP